MKRIVCTLAVLSLAYPLFAGQQAKADAELTDGREVLKKANEALKKVKLVSYRADYQGTQWITQFVPAVTGKVVLGELSEWEIPRFHCEVKLQKYGSEETQQFTAGADGDVYFLIDPATKMAYEDMDEAVLGSGSRNIQRVLMREFSQTDPFGEVLKDAESIELKDAAKVDEDECYAVNIKTKNPPELLWYISKKDFLPRKVVRTYEREGEKATTELTLFDLVVDPKLDKNPFKLSVPPGFKKTGDFAP